MPAFRREGHVELSGAAADKVGILLRFVDVAVQDGCVPPCRPLT